LAWAVKVTEEYATWFTALIKNDLGSAVQVAQAVAALREEGPTLGRPLVDRLKGSRIHHLKESPPGLWRPVRDKDHLRVRPRPVSAAAPRRRQDQELAAMVRDKIPAAEQLYIDYTIEDQE
jgi:hypothetical protein